MSSQFNDPLRLDCFVTFLLRSHPFWGLSSDFPGLLLTGVVISSLPSTFLDLTRSDHRYPGILTNLRQSKVVLPYKGSCYSDLNEYNP